jgi:hypothetical protein
MERRRVQDEDEGQLEGMEREEALGEERGDEVKVKVEVKVEVKGSARCGREADEGRWKAGGADGRNREGTGDDMARLNQPPLLTQPRLCKPHVMRRAQSAALSREG